MVSSLLREGTCRRAMETSLARLILRRSQRTSRSICHFNYHLNLDSIIERKARHPHSGPRVFAVRLAEDLHHQIGKSVDYLRLVAKTFGRVDHPKDFDHALHAIQATKRGAYLCQHDQANLARRVVAFLNGEVLADLAFVLPISSRSVSREEQQVTHLNRVDVIGYRRRHLR